MSGNIGTETARYYPLMLVSNTAGTLRITQDNHILIDNALANDPQLVYEFLTTWAKDMNEAHKQQPTTGSGICTGSSNTVGFCHTETEDEKLLRELETIKKGVSDIIYPASVLLADIDRKIYELEDRIKQQYAGVTTSTTAYLVVDANGEIIQPEAKQFDLHAPIGSQEIKLKQED